MKSFMYYEYGPVESFIDEDHIVGGIDPEIKKRRVVIRFISLLQKLEIKAATEFLFYPVYPYPGRQNTFQAPGDWIKKTMY